MNITLRSTLQFHISTLGTWTVDIYPNSTCLIFKYPNTGVAGHVYICGQGSRVFECNPVREVESILDSLQLADCMMV